MEEYKFLYLTMLFAKATVGYWCIADVLKRINMCITKTKKVNDVIYS
jgi:hypothetical protein